MCPWSPNLHTRSRWRKTPSAQTKAWIQGWLSIDRSEWAALLRTKPWPRIRSSTSDLAPGSPRTWCARQERGDHHPAAPQPRHERLCSPTGVGYRWPTEDPRRYGIVTFRGDSDLEAFSHNPTDGSFAPLAPQPSTYTKCLNLRFLSYWAGLLLQQHIISRVKLTCLTTV